MAFLSITRKKSTEGDERNRTVFKGGARASFLRQLRKASCENDFPIDFTKEINGRRCINQATSEQKLWSLGLLTDSILYPYWQNRSHFDDALQDPIVLHKSDASPGFGFSNMPAS